MLLLVVPEAALRFRTKINRFADFRFVNGRLVALYPKMRMMVAYCWLVALMSNVARILVAWMFTVSQRKTWVFPAPAVHMAYSA
jgi:hypothetical protein